VQFSAVLSILLHSSHLCLEIIIGVLLSGVSTNNLQAFFFCRIRATCPAHLTFSDLIIPIILSEEYKSRTPHYAAFFTLPSFYPFSVQTPSALWSQTTSNNLKQAKQTPWPLVRKRTIPTERPALVDQLVPTFVDRRVSRGQRDGSPTAVNLSFLDRSRYFSFKYLHLSSQGLSRPCSRPTATQKIWNRRESSLGPLG
jgi:hypothetical protein